MFGIFSVIRFSQFAAVLLTVGLVAFSGCRVLSPRSSPPTPSALPPVVQPPRMDEPDPHSAFRPVMPEMFTPPMIVLESPNIEPPRIASQPEVIAAQSAEQSKIDELSQRIEELETQLEEARQAPSPVNLIESQLHDVPPIETEVRTMRNLPIINKQGVNVYADESQHARIEVADRFLFMPNTWQLTAEGEETLRAIAAELRAFDSKSVLDIEGHTDSLMGDPNNPMQKHEISSIKTKVVMDFFVNALRWDAARIGTSSFGRSRPIADNGTPEGRAKNNRIEIVIREGS